MKPELKLFPELYETRDYEREAFGEHWCGPETIEREWTLVAKYYSPNTGDGQSVDVYCSAMPARFYKLDVLAGFNSIKEPKSGYEVKTGSGQHELVALLAEAIAEGMIGFHNK